jgi:hypothetical protein
MLTTLFVLAMGLLSGFIGYLYGWRDGTRDTERRWSDAVKRGDESRRIEAADRLRPLPLPEPPR